MTVNDLIDILKKYDKNAEVFLTHNDSNGFKTTCTLEKDYIQSEEYFARNMRMIDGVNIVVDEVVH